MVMATPPDDDRNAADDPTAVDAPRLSIVRAETAAESDPPTARVRPGSFVELPPGSVVGETYEVDARIGIGGMGEVYAARHLRLGKRVAIKVISARLSEDTAAIERFAREARTLARIQHPAIVAVDHVGELADGRAYFVMEYLAGESLFDRLEREVIPLDEALHILDQMARGLEAAHAYDVVHRDLKPENVFLVHLPGEPPVVKLLDFGLAKLRVADQHAERTQSGAAIGTPMYMSPEQMRGPDVDHRTDIYALGAVAYELLLGQSLFPYARTPPELYAAHLHEDPPLPRSIWSKVPPQLDLMLFAMVAKDPAHRPTLAQVRAVVAAVNAPARRAATEFVVPRQTSSDSNRWFAAIGAAALIVGVAIGVTIAHWPRGVATGVPVVEPLKLPPLDAGTIRGPNPAPVPTPIPAPPRPKTPKVTRAPVDPPKVPLDPGQGNAEVPPQKPPAVVPKPPMSPIDRNQIVNPFSKHHKESP